MKEKINKIITDTLKLTRPIKDSDRLDYDFGADPLDEIEIIMEIEEEFNIEISDRDAEMLVTIADFYALVESQTSD